MVEYPIVYKLTHGESVLIRSAESADIRGLEELLNDLPRDEMVIYKDDVSDKDSIESWFLVPYYKKTSHLVVLIADRIVAQGTLHSEGIYWQSAAEIKITVHPQYRNMGIAHRLFNLLLYEGFKNRVKRIIVRYTPLNRGFSKILEEFDFKPEATLKYYIRDESTDTNRDLFIASFDLGGLMNRLDYYDKLLGK